MQLEKQDRFAGIAFANRFQAINAIVVYAADFRSNAVFNGPEELFSLFENTGLLLGYDANRVKPLLDEIAETGSGMREYGNHIASSFSDITVGVWAGSDTSILKMENYFDRDRCEDTLVSLLNSNDALRKAHFEDKEYSRLLEQTQIKIKGTQEELDAYETVLKEQLGFFGEKGYYMGKINSAASHESGSSLPVVSHPVNITSSTGNIGTATMWFNHPRMFQQESYSDNSILRNAQDQIYQKLQEKLL